MHVDDVASDSSCLPPSPQTMPMSSHSVRRPRLRSPVPTHATHATDETRQNVVRERAIELLRLKAMATDDAVATESVGSLRSAKVRC